MRDFLHASYALFTDVHTAIDPLKGFSRAAEQITTPRNVVKPDTTVQNDQSMAVLQGMLANVQRRKR